MLPILTQVFVVSGAITKMVRQNMVRALRSDYILYARCCGLSKREVGGYALRAALTPAVTLVGIFYGVLLSAAVTVELVFPRLAASASTRSARSSPSTIRRSRAWC